MLGQRIDFVLRARDERLHGTGFSTKLIEIPLLEKEQLQPMELRGILCTFMPLSQPLPTKQRGITLEKPMERRILAMHHEPPAYTSHAVKAGNFLYVSGLIGMDYSTGTIAGMEPVDEIRQIVKNLKDILKHEHMSFDTIVKTTIYLTSMKYITDINKEYGSCFAQGNYPARDLVEVQMLPKNAKIEMSVIAYDEPKQDKNQQQKKKSRWG
jgi:2-iminobutanoate/2-iminopropanoate deaminase